MHYTDNPLYRYARDKSAPTPGSELDALYAGFAARLAAANLPADYRNATLVDGALNVQATQDGKRFGRREDMRDYFTRYKASFTRQFDEQPARVKSLYLWSTSKGVGKTTTAAALLIDWLAVHYLGAINRGVQPAQAPAYFLDVNEWQTLYNGFNRGHVPAERAERKAAEYYRWFDRAQAARFVVCDDVGLRQASEAFRADLHTVINSRAVNGLPTIYTSNIELAHLADVFDERLADRVRDQCLECHFEDKQSKRGIRK